VLRTFAALLIASPVFVLFGIPAIVGRRDEVPPAQQGLWMSAHVSAMMQFWFWGTLLYAVGFWFAFILLRRGVLGPRAVFLWWWALLCGLLASLFVPFGTLLALPCLVTLFRKRSFYFQRHEVQTGTIQTGAHL